MCLGHRGGLLFGGHADGTLSSWSLETRSLVCSAQHRSSAVLCVEAASNGKVVVAGSFDGGLTAYSTGEGVHLVFPQRSDL